MGLFWTVSGRADYGASGLRQIPPKACKDEAGGRGTVHAHITVNYQKQWLLERCRKHGFSLEDESFTVTDSRWLRFYKGNSGKRPVSLLAVSYEDCWRLRTPSCSKRLSRKVWAGESLWTRPSDRSESRGLRAMGNLPGMEKPSLQELPQIGDRLSFLYLERCQITGRTAPY